MAQQTAPLADGQHRDLPAAPAAGPRDADVEHDSGADRLVIELRRKYFAAALAEPAKIHAAAVKSHAVDRHFPDLAEADEDMPPLHGDNEPQRARRIARRSLQDHDVAHLADGQPIAPEQPTAGQP